MISFLRPTSRRTGRVCRFGVLVAAAGCLCVAAASAQQPIPLPMIADATTSVREYNAAREPEPQSYCEGCNANDWTCQLMPDGLIYRSYLAGPKEPRIGSVWSSERDFGATWDVTLGGRVGLWRYGTRGERPDGWELDIEGAAIPRLDPDGVSTPLIATDYRFGIPLTYGAGPWRTKVGYYHVSSHLGDEFMLANPGVTRINYVRDSFIAGISYYWTDELRTYGEFGYAAVSGGAEPVEFQFGAEYAPAQTTGFRGAPFAAINADLRQEIDFSGNLCVQTGWAWRNGKNGHLFRLGFQYLVGKDEQYEFFDQNVNKVGIGMWYDY